LGHQLDFGTWPGIQIQELDPATPWNKHIFHCVADSPV
jgi:hypothetical protein